MPAQLLLQLARAAARSAPFLPFDRHRLYPPNKFYASTPEWIINVGGPIGATLIKIDGTCSVVNKLPKTIYKNIRDQFRKDECVVYPETFVANIPGGRMMRRGLVVTPEGGLLEDISIYFYNVRKTIASSIASEWSMKQLDLDGRVAGLATDSANLYYHWLFQLLPRFELLRLAGMNWDEIDYYVINSQRNAFQRETLALLGINNKKIVESDSHPVVRARELIVPSVPLGTGCFRPWMTDFLRRTFLPSDHKLPRVGRRLYISRARAGYRRVINDGEVVDFLSRRGFDSIALETLSVREQAAAIASSQAIVAPHGGGLSNLVFASPGTKVIEIFSPELVAGYFWKLSSQINLDYYYLLGKGSFATLDSDYRQSWDAATDIEVDLSVLESTLALAGIR